MQASGQLRLISLGIVEMPMPPHRTPSAPASALSQSMYANLSVWTSLRAWGRIYVSSSLSVTPSLGPSPTHGQRTCYPLYPSPGATQGLGVNRPIRVPATYRLTLCAYGPSTPTPPPANNKCMGCFGVAAMCSGECGSTRILCKCVALDVALDGWGHRAPTNI